MNIEISEVSVLYTDSMSTAPQPASVGIAALDPHRARVITNVKHWRIPTLSDVLAAILARFTCKQPKQPFLPDPMFQKVQKLDRFLTIS
jgi:hypothetical protein